MERFSEEEMVRLLAYQRLYGPITPERLDLVAARLGMDVAAPHMKKGKKPRFKDHLITWSRSAREHKSPQQLLSTIRGWQRRYDRQDAKRGRRRGRREGGGGDGHAG